MFKRLAIRLTAFLCLGVTAAHAQPSDSLAGKLANFPTKFFRRVGAQSADLDRQVTRQTTKYLTRMARYEHELQERLGATDSTAARALFAGTSQKYSALLSQVNANIGHGPVRLSGQYFPYADTLQGAMRFLQRSPQLLSKGGTSTEKINGELQVAASQFQALEAKLQDAEVVKAFVRSRQEQLTQFLDQHVGVTSALHKPLGGIQQEEYYYSQRLMQYKAMLSDPDALAQRALSMLSQLPAFQSFMRTHSQLGNLFHVPGDYGTGRDPNALQTKEAVANAVKSQVGMGGAAGVAALQKSLQSAQSQLDSYKDRLKKLGIGNGDATMPNFKPNDQKTKTFFGRLQYGVDFQVTHYSNYYPSLLALGVNLGYKLGHSNVVGIGVAYQLGTGNGVRDVHFTSQGLGLRSFLDIKVKGSFSATGGFEYNYVTPFSNYQQLRQIQNWQRSGLLGVTKTISTKSKVLKQTTLSLLWDFLSYQNVPQTQPILFRMGYNF